MMLQQRRRKDLVKAGDEHAENTYSEAKGPDINV
jgi:hypothetical protein